MDARLFFFSRFIYKLIYNANFFSNHDNPIFDLMYIEAFILKMD